MKSQTIKRLDLWCGERFRRNYHPGLGMMMKEKIIEELEKADFDYETIKRAKSAVRIYDDQQRLTARAYRAASEGIPLLERLSPSSNIMALAFKNKKGLFEEYVQPMAEANNKTLEFIKKIDSQQNPEDLSDEEIDGLLKKMMKPEESVADAVVATISQMQFAVYGISMIMPDKKEELDKMRLFMQGLENPVRQFYERIFRDL